MGELITSLQNPHVKRLVKLQNRRARDKEKAFLIEGYRELLRAVDGEKEIEHVYYCEELFLGENEHALIRKTGAKSTPVAKHVFEKVSYRDRPDGLIAVAPTFSQTLAEIPLSTSPFILVAEAIEKPGNLGSILRSADAAGVDALILCDKCTDLFNPNVVRSSVGTLFTVPVVEGSSKEVHAFLKEKGIQTLAATPDAEEVYTDVPLTGPVAIVVGTEQLGLSDLWMNQADLQVKIPMLGHADSLNVAAATTLMLYEVVRQRTS